MNTQTKERSYALDFIKVIATTIILFHHYQQIGRVWYENHPNFFYNPHFDWSLMVELFFAISGFFAFKSQSATKMRLGSYLSGKLYRLLPLMACSTVVYAVLSYVHVIFHHEPWFFSKYPNLWGIVVSSLGLQTGLGLNGYFMNNPLWYVSVLIQCYCLCYSLLRISHRQKWQTEWVMAAVFFAVLFLQEQEWQLPFFASQTQRGYSSFLLGGFVARFVSAYRINRPVQLLCLGTIAITVAFMVFAPVYVDARSAFIFMICPALIILSQSEPAKRLFHHRIWQRLSEISFNVYVWHSPLQILLALAVPQIVYSEQVIRMYLFALVAWAVGTFSYFLLECPLRKKVPAIMAKVFVKH